MDHSRTSPAEDYTGLVRHIVLVSALTLVCSIGASATEEGSNQTVIKSIEVAGSLAASNPLGCVGGEPFPTPTQRPISRPACGSVPTETTMTDAPT